MEVLAIRQEIEEDQLSTDVQPEHGSHQQSQGLSAEAGNELQLLRSITAPKELPGHTAGC